MPNVTPDPKKVAYLQRFQQQLTQLCQDVLNTNGLLMEGVALGYLGSGTTPGSLADADVQSVFAWLTAPSFAASVTSVQALETQLRANNNALLASLLALRK